MAGLGKSASTGSLVTAGAAMSHIPKRAQQHGVFLPAWEVLPTQLKPGQKSLDRFLYGEEVKPNSETYLAADLPPQSVYGKTMSSLPKLQHYIDTVRPIKPIEPPADSAGYRGCSHWSSTYRTTHTTAALDGAAYHRQHGPSYQASNPPTCVGGAGSISSYKEDFGKYGSDPRSRVDASKDRIPIMKTELTAGSAKGTLHMPGYSGFLPLNTRNPYCARVASGVELRSVDKSNLTSSFHANVLGYTGHVPVDVSNDFGPINPGTRSMMGKSYQVPSLNAFH
jgi:hypothetical protein